MNRRREARQALGECLGIMETGQEVHPRFRCPLAGAIRPSLASPGIKVFCDRYFSWQFDLSVKQNKKTAHYCAAFFIYRVSRCLQANTSLIAGRESSIVNGPARITQRNTTAISTAQLVSPQIFASVEHESQVITHCTCSP